MAWYLNRALSTLRAEVNRRWPGRDKTSDGTIGDLAHQASASDHNPDSDGSVDAWDMDVDAVDVAAVIAAFEKHPAARYWIYNRQIATRTTNWLRERYYGANPHDKHVHFNTREGFEDTTAPWGVWPPPAEEDDMPTADEVRTAIVTDPAMKQLFQRVEALASLRPVITLNPGAKPPKIEPNRLADALSAAKLRDEAIHAEVAGDDQETVLARVDALAHQLAEQAAADAARDAQAAVGLAELRTLLLQHNSGDLSAEQVVDALARRLAADPPPAG